MTLAAAHLHMLKWSYQKCFRRRERPDRDIGRKREMKEEAYKILFLEDEPTIREVLTEYMLMSGYQVIGAERNLAEPDIRRKIFFKRATAGGEHHADVKLLSRKEAEKGAETAFGPSDIEGVDHKQYFSASGAVHW